MTMILMGFKFLVAIVNSKVTVNKKKEHELQKIVRCAV